MHGNIVTCWTGAYSHHSGPSILRKLMELKWSVPEYQDKWIPRLAIRDHMDGSRLAEVWVESGLLGQVTVDHVLAGKA